MTCLEDRWPPLLATQTWLRDQLLAAYAGAHRGYHDTRHLAEVLDHLDVLLGAGAEDVDADVVRLAAWFHDAVYDGERDDEERSALLAEETLARCDVPARLVAEVARLVRLTADHAPAAGDRAGQLLCDADLAILAADPGRYAEYAAGVRREYAHLDDDTFQAGRTRVLRGLLERPHLFHTAGARERWEPAARENVEVELARLRPPGPA